MNSDDEDSESDSAPLSNTAGPVRRSARLGGKQIDYAKLGGEEGETDDESVSENAVVSEVAGDDSGAEADDEGGSPDTGIDTPDIDMPDETPEATSGIWIGGYHWDFEPGFMDD